MNDGELLETILGIPVNLPMDRLEVEGPARLRGVGAEQEARRLEAVLELHRRLARSLVARGDPISSPRDLHERFAIRYRGAIREECVVVLLDGQNRVIREVTFAIGTRDAALVVPRDALVEAIRESASAVAFVHNHPSGNPLPSPEDVQVTRRLREVCALAGIRFVDHVIVGEQGYFSFREEDV